MQTRTTYGEQREAGGGGVHGPNYPFFVCVLFFDFGFMLKIVACGIYNANYDLTGRKKLN